jgi:NADH-quinone oxidoreductase subunit H
MLESIGNWIVTHPWIWIAFIAHFAILGTVAYLILLERKIASWVQDRIGPNRVGLGGLVPLLLLPLAPFINVDKIADRVRHMHMFGLGQPLADGLKFILKEDYGPRNVDKILFTVAPMVMILVMIISIAVLPWGGIKQTTRTIDLHGRPLEVAAQAEVPVGGTLVSVQPAGNDTASVTYRYPFQIADLDIGVLFVLAILSLAVYGVVVGGWASNNKYSFLGGLRATANMISYEVPLGLSVLTIVVMFGTLNLNTIVDKQATYWFGFIPAWNVFCQPLAFLMFLLCIHAEANRAPFDTAEAEQELVGGYHTEYSSMRFALFFLAEYAGMITTSVVCAALFFGGWHIPWIDKLFPVFGGGADPSSPAVTTSLIVCLIRSAVIFAKTLAIIGVFMWVRWTLPRFRFDQIMSLAWRALIPISLIVLLATATTIWLLGSTERAYLRVSGRMALVLFFVNAAVLAVVMIGSKLVPAAPDTNRKIRVPGSRFENTPLPAGTAV